MTISPVVGRRREDEIGQDDTLDDPIRSPANIVQTLAIRERGRSIAMKAGRLVPGRALEASEELPSQSMLRARRRTCSRKSSVVRGGPTPAEDVEG